MFNAHVHSGEIHNLFAFWILRNKRDVTSARCDGLDHGARRRMYYWFIRNLHALGERLSEIESHAFYFSRSWVLDCLGRATLI